MSFRTLEGSDGFLQQWPGSHSAAARVIGAMKQRGGGWARMQGLPLEVNAMMMVDCSPFWTHRLMIVGAC